MSVCVQAGLLRLYPLDLARKSRAYLDGILAARAERRAR